MFGRYFLTKDGLRILALRAGVPPQRFARHACVAAYVPGWAGDGRLRTLMRQFDHTVGVNRFVVGFIGDARRQQLQVVRWLSASEGAQRFVHEGATHWLRPDAVLDVHWQGSTVHLYIEWDRGTMRLPEINQKLTVYAAAPTPCINHKDGHDSALLFVTTTPQREAGIRQAQETVFAERGASTWNVLTTTADLLDRLGSFERVWLDGHAGGRIGLLEAPPFRRLSTQPEGPD